MTPTRNHHRLTWRFWLAPVVALVGGLVLVVPDWLGIPGLSSLFSAAPRSAEGAAAPFVATLRILRVLGDLAYLMFLVALGLASAAGARMARDPVSCLALALAPVAILGLLSAACTAFLSESLQGIGPAEGTLVVAGLAGIAAGFAALLADNQHYANRDES